MHVFDHHGLTGIVAASTLRTIVLFHNAFGSNQDLRARINKELKEYNSNNRLAVTIPPLTLQSLVLGSGWAEIHGPLYKSAIVKNLAPFSLQLALQCFKGKSAHDVAVVKANTALCDIYDILYTADIFMTDPEQLALQKACDNLGLSFQVLRHLSEKDGLLLWQIKPKVHIAMHVPFQAGLINPKNLQNYGEESLIGKVTGVWESSANGPYHASIQKQALVKWLLLWIIEVGLD